MIQLKMSSKSGNCSFFQTITLTAFLLTFFLPHHGATAAARYQVTRIGAIINDKTRVGKEAKVAMEIAARNFNDSLKYHKLVLHFNFTGGNPLQASYAAEELIREKDVQALVGTGTWEETASVAEVGTRAKVPVISFASNAVSQPLNRLQWPYLLQMAGNVTEQINIIAAIIHSFKWRKVIAIYELDRYGGDSGTFVALTEALREISVEIEYRSALPPFASLLPDSQGFVKKEVEELTKKKSRVFIVLRSSVSLAAVLFKEAKEMGLTGQDSAWIVMEDIASLLQSVNTSVISTMEGTLGIKQYYSEESVAFLDFEPKFRRIFQSEYHDENNLAGIYALRAHDSVTAIARATVKLSSSKSASNSLLKTIISENFTGLSGNIQFYRGELLHSSVYRLVNVAPLGPINLGFWSPEFGFSKNLTNLENGSSSVEMMTSLVKWPGGLMNRVPKGWSMPNDGRKMIIGIPGRTTFEKFVKVEWNNSSSSGIYPPSGYCIDVFDEVVKILEKSYPFPYEFYPYNGTYDDLVDHVANKSYDAVIGDVTILANRSKYVEFTQPYAESGLAMIVPEKPDNSWIFLRPFTKEMWAVTAAILIYTVLIVWLLERRQSNPEFQGSWQDQLSVALWFTFSSLFFAQKEQVRSNYTRVVVIVWFFVVLTLTTSYTASLSSLLTVTRLQPNVTDINWLRTHNSTIGCDGDSFIWNYLQEVLEFKAINIKNISSEYNYPGEFESGNITAAFLELPYEKTFLNQYCKRYTVPETTKYKGDRFGGLGFVFQKGSPIATDVSEAILVLSENGVLKQLHEKWFTPFPSCKTSQNTLDYSTDSLSWKSFWGLYLFSAATSTISYLIFTAHQFYQLHHREADNTSTALDYNVLAWNKFVALVSYFYSYREQISTVTIPVTDQESIVNEGA